MARNIRPAGLQSAIRSVELDQHWQQSMFDRRTVRGLQQDSYVQQCNIIWRAHPDLNQGPADLQSAALTIELCTQLRYEAKHGSSPSGTRVNIFLETNF